MQFMKTVYSDLDEIHISDGLKIKLIIDSDNEESNDIMNLATEIYDGLSEKDISEIEKITLDRKDFFEYEN